MCDCCGLPLSSGKSKGNTTKVAYYTFHKKCPLIGGLNAEKFHDEFDRRIADLKPDKRFLAFLKILLQEEWGKRQKDERLVVNATKKRLREVEKDIEKFLDLVVNTTSETVRKRYEQRIEELEHEKSVLIAKAKSHEEEDMTSLIDSAFKILSDPYAIWKG